MIKIGEMKELYSKNMPAFILIFDIFLSIEIVKI
jgi:hypothetical protein